MKNLIGSGENMASPHGDPITELRSRRERARFGGGRKALEAIRATGRGTARDRIDLLLDPDSFVEVDTFVTHRTKDHNMFLHQTLGDGVVTGHGTIDGRRVYCFAQDFSVHGGSMGEMHAKKIAKLVEMAERSKTPLVCVWDGGGQRAHDGIYALAGTGELLYRLVQCSGRVPVISLVLGPVVGVSALAASLSDFTILGEEHGQLFLSSPWKHLKFKLEKWMLQDLVVQIFMHPVQELLVWLPMTKMMRSSLSKKSFPTFQITTMLNHLMFQQKIQSIV